MRNEMLETSFLRVHHSRPSALGANDPVADAVAAAHVAANDTLGYVDAIMEQIDQAQHDGASEAVIDVMHQELARAKNAAALAAGYANQADEDYASYQQGVPSARKLVMADSANAQAQDPLGLFALVDNGKILDNVEKVLQAGAESTKTVKAIQDILANIQKLLDQATASGVDPAFLAQLKQQLTIAQGALKAAQEGDRKTQAALAAYMAKPSWTGVQPVQDADAAVVAQKTIAQAALDAANTIMQIIAVTHPDDIGDLNGYQASFAAAGLITLLQFLIDNDNKGSTDKLQLLIRGKLDELKALSNLPVIDGTTPPVTAADWITQAENSKTKADFEWWKVSTTTTDPSGKKTTVQGPIGLLITDLKQWNADSKIQPQLLAPESDDGFYTFATSMLFVGIGARTEGSVSEFSEFFMGAEDASGSTQYFFASRAIAYYLSLQTTQAGGPLTTDDLQAFVDAINYKPNGNDWDQNTNPFGSQPNMYLFFYGSKGTPYDPTHEPGTSPDGLIAFINAVIAHKGKWDESKGPTSPKNFVIEDADAAWGSFVDGTSQRTSPDRAAGMVAKAHACVKSAQTLVQKMEDLLATLKAKGAPQKTIDAVADLLSSAKNTLKDVEGGATRADSDYKDYLKGVAGAEAKIKADANYAASYEGYIQNDYQKALALAPKQAVAAVTPETASVHTLAARAPVNSDGSWPIPDRSDGALDSRWFNTDVYDNDNYQSGADPSASNFGKLRRMIQWMHNHPWNKEAPLVFAQYVSNLIKMGKITSGSPLEGYLNGLSVNGKTIIDSIIDLIVTQKFYQEQDPNWDPTNLFNNLQNLFKGDDAFAKDAAEYIADWKSRWTNFVQTNAPGGVFKYSADDFNKVASANWGNFLWNIDFGPWGKQIMLDMMDGLLKRLLTNPNANILLVLFLLLFLMTEQTGTDDLGGLGAGSTRLKKHITDLGKISDAWSDGSCAKDPAAADNWVDSIQQYVFDVDNDPSMRELKGDISSALDGNTGILSQQSPFCDANGNPLTLEQLHDNPTAPLFQKDAKGVPQPVMNAATPPIQETYRDGQLATIQNWQIDPQGVRAPPAQYGTSQNDFKGAQSTMSTQASTTATAVQQKTSYVSSVESSLKSSLDAYTKMGDAFVQNQKV